MRLVEFTWDERKAQANVAKHGINFVDARYVFADSDAVYQQDRVVAGEERWQVIGWPEAMRY